MFVLQMPGSGLEAVFPKNKVQNDLTKPLRSSLSWLHTTAGGYTCLQRPGSRGTLGEISNPWECPVLESQMGWKWRLRVAFEWLWTAVPLFVGVLHEVWAAFCWEEAFWLSNLNSDCICIIKCPVWENFGREVVEESWLCSQVLKCGCRQRKSSPSKVTLENRQKQLTWLSQCGNCKVKSNGLELVSSVKP